MPDLLSTLQRASEIRGVAVKNLDQLFGARARLCRNTNRKGHRIGRSGFAVKQFKRALFVPVTDPCAFGIAKSGPGGLIRYSIHQLLIDSIEHVIRTLSDAVEASIQCALRPRGRAFVCNGLGAYGYQCPGECRQQDSCSPQNFTRSAPLSPSICRASAGVAIS
jgi:hypothetical protein